MRLLPATLALLLLASLAQAEEPTVVVISMDGVRHDYPDRIRLPALTRMARDGARAERLVPAFPPDTFPAHVSLATGTHSDRHGIVANEFRDRERGLFEREDDASWILAEPLWAAAERQGVPTAAFFWVGSETDWRGRGASFRMAPFDSKIPERTKVEQILAWLDLPERERPRLIMSWWHGADRAGHVYGPDSDEVGTALTAQDAELARLLAGIDARGRWPVLTLILVSDHGMSLATEGIDLDAALGATGIEGEVLHSTAVAHLFLEDPSQASRAAQALGALEGIDAYVADGLPTELRLGPPARIGDVVCLTRPPHTFHAGAVERAMRVFGRGIGGHGYRPEVTADVAGVFLAMGRGVAAGRRLGPVHAIDVAPTAARLLGIEPPAQSEGKALDLSTRTQRSVPIGR